MEINGIAHVMLTVSNFDACLPFYERLLAFLGLRTVLKMNGMLYCVGGRTAVGIVRAEDRWRNECFEQLRVGLHHLCFRARERADVDALHEFLVAIGAKIVHPPEDGPWARDTILYFLKIPTASAWRSTTSPEKGSSPSGFMPYRPAVPHAAIVTVNRTASRIDSSRLFEDPDGIVSR